MRLLASVFAWQIGSTCSTYWARVGPSSAAAAVTGSSASAATDTAAVRPPFMTGGTLEDRSRGAMFSSGEVAQRDRSLGFAAVISTNEFRSGSHIEIDGKIFRIIEFQHVKPGKGGAFVRTKLRRIEDGSVQDKTFRAGEKFRPVRTESKKMQYLYDSGEAAVFMDSLDYDQIEITKEQLGDSMQWVLPNAEVDVLFVDEAPSDVQVPSAIEMKVTQTDPGLRGDTASGGGSKPATLESGVVVQVPLFVEEGDSIRVDTRSGEYISRA